MKKKIATLTFHASHNYGSMLQAYALQTFLKKHGVNTEIVNFRSEEQKKMYSFPENQWNIKQWIYVFFLNRSLLDKYFKWFKFEFFIRKNMRTSYKEYKTWSEIEKKLRKKYKAIIVGGDQIWNYTCRDWDISYLLPSKFKNVKKVAFSPSMGPIMERFENEDIKKLYYKHLYDFDYISVRDNDGAYFLTKLLGKKVKTLVDPTMLLSLSDYSSFIGDKPIVHGSYILYYSPFENYEVENKALQYATLKNKRILTTNSENNIIKEFEIYDNVGPKEFLNILYYADEVVGQSYHLLVFSLLFHKEFLLFGRALDSRINGLLESLGLEDRFINQKSDFPVSIKPINFYDVDHFIDIKRKESISFLLESLA